jgi:uncharacterized integral membrane protein
MKLRVDHQSVGPDTPVTLLAAHYQHTYELTYEFWKQRNRVFLMLLGSIIVGILLTARVSEANNLLVDAVAKLVGTSENPERMEELRKGFPYAVVEAGILVLVFYMAFNLYHRNSNLGRLYDYLEKLECDMRQLADFGAVGFTREGAHYGGWQSRPLRPGSASSGATRGVR